MAASTNLPRNGGNHQYGTWYACNYDLPAHRLCQFEKKPLYAGLQVLQLDNERHEEVWLQDTKDN